MKTVKIIYWVSTILFALIMSFTAIPSLMNNKESLEFMTHLGYPLYFVQFISVAKILGGVTLILPGLTKAKEWAYAGLFFDLAGALFSIYAVDGINPGMAFIGFCLLLGVVSYLYKQKKNAFELTLKV